MSPLAFPPDPPPASVRPADSDGDAERTAILKQIRETRLSPTTPRPSPRVVVDGKEVNLDDRAELTLDKIRAVVQQNKAACAANRQSLADLRAAHASSPVTKGFKIPKKGVSGA